MLDETQVEPQINYDALQPFVSALIAKRREAISARQASGIEDDWREDEEAYMGIDDANRGFVRPGTGVKADRAIGREATEKSPGGARSRVYLNVTRPYVDAAAARLADMLLPTAEPCYAVKPTPIADLIPAMAEQLKALGLDPVALQEASQATAEKAAEGMQKEIDDILTECGWQGEVRSVIEDSARIGSGVLKGPVPQRKTIKKWQVVVGVGQLTVMSEIKPGSVRIDPWNFFPDAAGGENIHNGAYTWERAYTTAKVLRGMIPEPGQKANGIIPGAIEKVLLEGPKQITARVAGDGLYTPVDGQYEMWTCYCTAAQDDARAAGLTFDDSKPGVNVMALLVNDQLIKISENPQETGEFPYDVLAWQRRPGMPWGMGVARHIRTPQRMLNAATRAIMDNAGQITGMQLIIGNGVKPQSGVYEIGSRELWRAEPETLDVRGAMWAFVPPSVIDDLLKIVELARAVAEQTTGMPMLLQGQQTQGQAADTLGGMQLLQNNATGVLRRLAKRFDDYLVEPHIRRYFHWLMQHSEKPEIKGDLQVNALGSSSLVERDSQKQFMFASMAYANDPAYGIDPYKLYAALARSDRMDPTQIQIPEEDHKKRLEMPDPLTEAQTALANAKAAESEAATVLKRVEALFSAINTANLVASNPAIAPAADQTAMSAGFKDQNAPPIVSAVPPGAEPVPVEENTSPMFPPNPPQADVGLLAGVEGGQP